MPRPPRPCIECGTWCVHTRCAPCEAKQQAIKDAQRKQRDPNHRNDHRRARTQLAPRVAAGNAYCTRCGQTIQPDEPWDADRRPWGYEPSHATCNRAAGGRREP